MCPGPGGREGAYELTAPGPTHHQLNWMMPTLKGGKNERTGMPGSALQPEKTAAIQVPVLQGKLEPGDGEGGKLVFQPHCRL